MLTSVINTNNASQTEAWAAALGARLRGGEVIELVSDLGGGKTTFVRGMVSGLGSSDIVSSPTFTISKVYQAGGLEVHHFDFYRLPEAGLMAAELADYIGDEKIVVVMEWAGVVDAHLPSQRVTIKIEQKGGDKRRLEASYPDSLKYLFEAQG